jgi:uncharacterized protein (DUF2252 family)
MTASTQESQETEAAAQDEAAASQAASAKVTHLTPEERAALGKAARAKVPRALHAALEIPSERDPVAYLQEQDASRVPELVPIKYGRMLVSAFTFYRGAANIMAHDLGAGPRSGLNVQLCGDAHLSNFGGFASPDRALIFDLNDFDETHPGPFEWDVKRLAASFEIAGRDRGFTDAERRDAVLAVGRAYRESMREFALMSNLGVWYARLTAEEIAARLRAAKAKRQEKALTKGTAKARTKDSMKAFNKLTTVVDGELRIVSDPPLIVPIEELAEGATREAITEELMGLFRTYRRSLQGDRRVLVESFRYVDLARKVVGVGSVGTRAWIMLMLGRDDEDPLFLQVKEAQASVLEPALGKSKFRNHGQRVVEGQRLMQAASDIFLGWIRNPAGIDGVARDFYVRQLWDWKTSADLDTVVPQGLVLYAYMCGWTIARAHARSGDRIAIASYLGKGDVFERAMADFATAYADLNQRDYDAVAKAVRDGRITAEEGL